MLHTVDKIPHHNAARHNISCSPRHSVTKTHETLHGGSLKLHACVETQIDYETHIEFYRFFFSSSQMVKSTCTTQYPFLVEQKIVFLSTSGGSHLRAQN